MQEKEKITLPKAELIRSELKRERNRIRYRRVIKSAI